MSQSFDVDLIGNVVADWCGGCTDGKIQFLEYLGIDSSDYIENEDVSEPLTYRLVIEMTDSPNVDVRWPEDNFNSIVHEMARLLQANYIDGEQFVGISTEIVE